MNYELLTVGKVNSTVTGRSSSDEEPIRNFSELLNRFRRYDWLALQSAVVDFYRDLELVDVEGSTIDGGRDDPHKEDKSKIGEISLFGVEIGIYTKTAIDDIPHYSSHGRNFSAFNHFIDIKKGYGRFDDFDGYSYEYGSAHRDQYQLVEEELKDWEGWEEFMGWFVEQFRRDKVDQGLNYWLNDEYVHAPGQPWYRHCSPSIERYSFFYEKGIYRSLEEESRARFPLADSTGERGKGIPYSIFMPVDNMARYWYEEFLRTGDWLALGP